MADKYKEGEKFYEVTFEIPINNLKPEDVARVVISQNKEAHNIKVIPCRVYKEPRRLSVSKDGYSYTLYNSKERSQILD